MRRRVGKTILLTVLTVLQRLEAGLVPPLLSFKGTAAIAPAAGTAPLEISTALHIYISLF